MERTKILYDRETMRQLVGIFKVSSRTVRDALSYKTKSVLADRIRTRALLMGCKEKDVEVIKKANTHK
ncbi:MAG: hypothetical protein LBS05_09515 [Tannerellaceae bacterium]|jgi:hypothetical protein|nr:hypothetical protein [Tannerellaceae bacterium]